MNRTRYDPGPNMPRPPAREAVLEQLERLLSSAVFQGAARSRALLKFLVTETLEHRADRLKEYTLGAEALEKGDAFDPRTDPIVRAEASRLRSRLDRYYTTEGLTDPVLIVLPRGAYVPQFRERAGETGDEQRPRRIHAVEWAAAGAVMAAFLLAVATWMTGRTAAAVNRPLVRVEVELKSNGVLGSEVGTDVVLSPDGTRIAFVSRDSNGLAHLNTRPLDQPNAVVIVGTDGARGPFFSPDSQWIAFWADRALKKVAVAGGPPTIVCDAPDLLGGSWGDDGYIVATLHPNTLTRVAASGGSPAVVADFTRDSIAPRWPQILPGGNLVLFTAIGPAGPNTASINVLSLSDGKTRVVVRGGTYGRYIGDRYLTYVNQGTLFAVPFDVDRIVVRGSAIPVLDDVSYSSTFGYAQLDVSRDGSLVYRRDAAGGQFILQSIDPTGVTETLISKPAHYGWPRLSPDGERVALSVTQSGVENLLLFDRRTRRIERIGAVPGDYAFPVWTRDGRALILGAPAGLASISTDSARTFMPLLPTQSIAVPWSLSPDGRRLAYYAMGASSGFDLWTVPIHESASGLSAGTPEPFLASPFFEAYPSFSPDGRWVAYSSNESGPWEIYVRKFPDDGTKVAVSSNGGHIPFWLPNGRQLLYENEDHRLFIVNYTADRTSFRPGAPRPWANARLGDTAVLANVDVSPDGMSVVALTAGSSANEQTPNHITLLMNFFDELRRRGL